MSYGDEAKRRQQEYRKAHKASEEERTSARGLLWYANDYYQAYQSLTEAHPKDIELLAPKFYLLCHSLELCMKSWLRHEGHSTKQLRDFGHDLMAALTELIEKHDVTVAPAGIQSIDLANRYYDTKQYEYFIQGFKSLPEPTQLSTYVRMFLGMTKSHILGPESLMRN